LSNTPAIADSVCSYDLDQLDEAWLQEFNGERSMCGLPPVNEEQFERIIEELEVNMNCDMTFFSHSSAIMCVRCFLKIPIRHDVMTKFKQ
jgi:hypothetical protein